MHPPKPVGELLAGYLALAIAAIVMALALRRGEVSPELAVGGTALLALAVALAVATTRALSNALSGLLRSVERLAGIALPGWRWTGTDDLDGLAAELNVMAPRLRDRLEELTEDRDRAGQILDALDDGILLLDGAGRLLVANPTARAWFGLPDELRPGLPLRRVVSVRQIAELAEEATTKRAPVSGTVTVVLPEHRTLTLRAFPLSDRGPTGRTVVTLSDITQRRRLEVLRRDFVANASHELKTPVAALRALAETLESALPDDPEAARGFVVRIGREAERLDALVRDLLDLSRVERGALDIEPVDMVGLVKEVAESHADRAEERHIRLRTELQPGSSVRGDGAQLSLMLSNLVDNALRYTAARGTVRIRLDSIDDKVILRVADTGEGIPASELPRVFERFYRVDKARARRTGGTGLGLAIVRHVAESHGGRVTVESKVGKGSAFTITLPVGGPPSTVGN
ncbi:MAG TPA: ATP-binding protein [Actinomycetes bacterium]|jgi:two-component system phosphate regulon sensor histidine kinase PhoR|nr:ATP-binding protein [Actinomycetes bacterium]